MFTGEESLGKPYVYEVSFMSPVLLDVETLVDTNVKVLLQDVKTVDKQRTLFGKVYQAKHTDSVGDKHLYTFTVVHPLYYLGLNRRYEIYQDQSAFDVMQTLLTRYKGLLGIDFHTNITPGYFTKREYTTQYNQSDLEFVQMLCEQEGVTLHMETGEPTHKVRLAHINETFTELHSELRCNYNSTKAFSVTHTQENYYDFRIPSKEYLKETGASPLSQSLGDNAHTASLRDALLNHTQHDRLDVSRPKNLQGLMDAHSKSMYSNSEAIKGKSQALEAGIGRGGTLFDTKALKRTEAILTKVRYKGIFPNALEEYTGTVESVKSYSYEVAFEATPIETVFVPAYNITKPLIPSSVTALVSDGSKKVGMPSRANTIDVDAFGRIRVIFHFDNKYPTSCYIRFTNFSAGDGWGSQFIPRVNTEVIVNFLNGDPDRPVAIGSLYNGNNDIPKSLPANKTQSYIKTQSMPGGSENFNLLLFEDKGGDELVHMQAEKNH
jgi:type VI secretion system secreted protein VgrG